MHCFQLFTVSRFWKEHVGVDTPSVCHMGRSKQTSPESHLHAESCLAGVPGHCFRPWKNTDDENGGLKGVNQYDVLGGANSGSMARLLYKRQDGQAHEDWGRYCMQSRRSHKIIGCSTAKTEMRSMMKGRQSMVEESECFIHRIVDEDGASGA